MNTVCLSDKIHLHPKIPSLGRILPGMIRGRGCEESGAMEGEVATDFPGFRTDILHRGEHACRRLPPAPTRLQKRAPCPLQLKNGPQDHDAVGFGFSSPASSSMYSGTSEASDSTSFHRSKDPIPLLSPFVVIAPPPTGTASGQAGVENSAAGSC